HRQIPVRLASHRCAAIRIRQCVVESKLRQPVVLGPMLRIVVSVGRKFARRDRREVRLQNRHSAAERRGIVRHHQVIELPSSPVLPLGALVRPFPDSIPIGQYLGPVSAPLNGPVCSSAFRRSFPTVCSSTLKRGFLPVCSSAFRRGFLPASRRSDRPRDSAPAYSSNIVLRPIAAAPNELYFDAVPPDYFDVVFRLFARCSLAHRRIDFQSAGVPAGSVRPHIDPQPRAVLVVDQQFVHARRRRPIQICRIPTGDVKDVPGQLGGLRRRAYIIRETAHQNPLDYRAPVPSPQTGAALAKLEQPRSRVPGYVVYLLAAWGFTGYRARIRAVLVAGLYSYSQSRIIRVQVPRSHGTAAVGCRANDRSDDYREDQQK